MKLKLLFILSFLSVYAFGQDKVYPTELKYDDDFEMHYFDINLAGNTIYTGYGLDFILPQGMKVVSEDGELYILMLDADLSDNVIYPKTLGKYTHTVSSEYKGGTRYRVACFSSKNKDFLATNGGLFRVFVEYEYSDGWPLGGITIKDAELDTSDEKIFNPQNQTFPIVLHSGKTTLPLSVSATAHWSTCILPFDAAIPEGVEAYTCEGVDGDVMNLAEETEFKAYTPYILYSETGFSGTVTGTVETTHPAEGYVNTDPLCGAILPQTAKDGFVMQNLDGEVMFYPIKEGSTFTIPAGKCWVPASQNLAKVRSIDFNVMGATGIVERKSVKVDGNIYSLDGRIVTEMIPGKIYIQNGEKVMKTK